MLIWICFLSQERAGGIRAHLDDSFCVHRPVFRTEQLKACRAVIAYCLYCICNFLYRDGTEAGHQAVAVVKNAEREVFAVIDMEDKQLVLRNLADIIDIRTLVVQVDIDAVDSQADAVAIDCLNDFQRLADTVAAPFSVTDRLKGQLDKLRDSYDYILIDCPPSLGMLTVNALSAADQVLIPVQAQYLPAKGMTKLLQTINKVQRKINSNLTIAGVAITLADMKTNLAKSTIETIRDSFGRNIRVFDSVIPVATKAGEASISGKSIYSYAKDSKVASAYSSLTDELISSGKPKQRNDFER